MVEEGAGWYFLDIDSPFGAFGFGPLTPSFLGECQTAFFYGLKKSKNPQRAQKNAYLRRKLKMVEQFDKKDQKTIASMIDSLEKSYQVDKTQKNTISTTANID